MQADLPLEKQVAHLSQAVSRHLFRNQTITAKVLKNKKGESIAHVDLANLDDSWYQGSSGGGDTQNRLVNSYLQKDLDEAWIDGLRFFIDGSPFGYGDHINLNYGFRRHGKHIELKQQ